MSYLTEGNVTAIAGVVTSFLAGIGGYLAAKRKTKMSERELLSKDEQTFRAELREELQTYREEVVKLQIQIAQLHRTNIELQVENQQLMGKIDGLTFQLKKWKIDTEGVN